MQDHLDALIVYLVCGLCASEFITAATESAQKTGDVPQGRWLTVVMWLISMIAFPIILLAIGRWKPKEERGKKGPWG